MERKRKEKKRKSSSGGAGVFRIDAGAQSKRRGSFPGLRDIASDTGSGTRLGDAGEEVKRKGVGRRLELGLWALLHP